MFSYQPPPHEGLDILYEDKYLLVVNKPAGLLSVPGRGADKQDCMISRVQATHPNALIVHRLDMSTSGILVLALDKETHRELSKQFQERKVSKQYIAIVKGQPKKNEGMIDKPMTCDWPNRPKQIISEKQGKQAQTRYKILEYFAQNNTSRLLLTPITGRTHQLRLHCQFIGHPILGDQLYADSETKIMAKRLLLHSTSICFKHPNNHDNLNISCPSTF